MLEDQLVFAHELYSAELVEEMLPLWKAHNDEVPGIKDIPLEPNLSVYEDMDRAGILRIFTVRDNVSLHGYQVMMVSAHPHSKNSIQAVQDILYICPAARKGMTGYRFIKWCCDQLRNEGVQVVYQYIDARNDFGHLLERIGYRLQDLSYARRLC